MLLAYRKNRVLSITTTMLMAAMLFTYSCKRSGSGGIDILGPVDETEEAAKLVASANEDLTKIKVLYEENEGKRQELKKAMEANDAAKAKKIADDVVYLINDGAADGNSAVEKIQKAQEMQINDDYREYLRLKEESLKRQLEAFDNYRMAARTLRDSYDPKNAAMREKVKEEFKTRSENYRKIMEEARDYSKRANELAKDVLRRQQQAQ
jgi:hypothetical protein